MTADAPMVKVKLESPDGDVETLWATPVGEHLYRLENSPFFAYGVSWLDVVEARPDPAGQLAMARVVEKSGHRTVRVILDAPAAEPSDSWEHADPTHDELHPQEEGDGRSPPRGEARQARGFATATISTKEGRAGPTARRGGARTGG
jgi:hypothetical protein